MPGWNDISLRAIKSAQLLKENSDLRGSINRAYYAAYSAVVHALPGGLVFPRGRRNPPHELIPRLMRDHRLFRNDSERRVMNKCFNLLKDARITADYRPRHDVDGSLTLVCIKSAQQILKALAVV